jgi:hypothetical protein
MPIMELLYSQLFELLDTPFSSQSFDVCSVVLAAKFHHQWSRLP